MKKIIISIATFVIFLVLGLKPTYAVNFSSSLSPSTHHVLIKPGSQGKVQFILHNNGDPVSLQLKLSKVDVQNDSLSFEDSNESLITFEDSSFEKPFIMTSNEIKNITINIAVPSNQPEGDYYYAVRGETIPDPAPEGKTTVQLQGSVYSFLLVTVKDNAALEYAANITTFATKPLFKFTIFNKKINIFDLGQPIHVSLVVQNVGETVFKGHGFISIQNGQDSRSYPLASRYILVNSQTEMSTPLAAGSDSLVLKNEKIGLYSLKATVTTGKQGRGVTAHNEFVVLPVKALLIILFIAFLSPIFLIFYINRVQK